MCGRYVLYGPVSRYSEYFNAQAGFEFGARFNVTPSQVMPVVWQHGGVRELTTAKWGLIPSWVKDPAGLTHPINAKAETVAIKPMFRSAFKKCRVLVPADAFYEWRAVPGGKQPNLIRLRDKSPMGFAGLLEHWAGPEGEVQTFTLLTTEPNPLMAAIHNRMPAIIRPEDYEAWLDTKVVDVNVLQTMLSPYPDRLMEVFPVSKRVNSPANDGPELIEREEGVQ